MEKKFIFNQKRLILSISLILLQVLFCTVYAQQERIDLSVKNTELKDVLKIIENKTEYVFFYNNSEIDDSQKVSAEVSQKTIPDMLDIILTNSSYTIDSDNKKIYLHPKQQNKAPTITITGIVTDESREPVIGASVSVKGAISGTVTDIDGHFSLDVTPNSTLVFNYIGYNPQEIVLTSGKPLSIILEEKAILMDDVVVIGYATGNKRSISGAVEKVSRENMNKGIVTEPLDALKGRVAGVVISGTGGNPTEDLSIRIRGTTSLSGGNDPLVIIDGVFGSISMLNALSKSDIESMTILKDASETAQYGSRGASGVIVVTTLKGVPGFSNIEYNGSFGVNTVYKTINMLSADQWRTGVKQLGVDGVDMGGNSNWFDEISRNTLTQTHNFSINNGTETSSFRASLGLVDRPGLIRNTNSRQYTAKIDGSQYAFDKKVRLDIGMFGSRHEGDKIHDVRRLFYSAASYNPTYPNHKNEEGVWDEDLIASEVHNPMGLMDITNKYTMTHINAHGSVNYEIIKGLNLIGFASYTYYSNNEKLYVPNDIYEGASTRGRATLKNGERSDLMGNLQLNFVRDFGKHSINTLALLEAQKQDYFTSGSTVSGFDTNYFKYNNMQAGANLNWGDVTSNSTKYQLLSYMVRANYMYDGKYVFTGNLRRDGSSKLGINDKWGFFPSASVAWIVTGEEFMKSVPWVNTLKVRAGYGVTGNQDAISAYNSLELMTPNGTTLVDGSPTTTFAVSSNANPDLRWEKKYTFDVGLDLSMFDSRLRMTADYYISRTKDMLYTYTVPVPPFVYTTMLANLGEMSNNGVELSVSGDVIRTKDFSFNMGVNLSFQRNKVESLSGTYKGAELTTSQYIELASASASGLIYYNGVTYLTEGQPVGIFYIPKFSKFVELDGKKTYEMVDLDENGTIDLSNSGDRYVAGNAIPKTYLGAHLSFRYKNFDLVTQLNGAFGHHIYNGTSMTFNNVSIFPTYNLMEGAIDQSIYDIKISDYWLEKGDYLNIEYISLGYNLPVKKCNLKYLKELHLAFSVNNVATITGYSGMNPMINSATVSNTLGLDDKRIYPLNRTYSFTVGIKF